MIRVFAIVLLALVSSAAAQTPTTPPPYSGPLEFDVVSIKKSDPGNTSGGIRSLPDGTMLMTNQPMASIIAGAAPVPVRGVVGYPDWVDGERYDVTVKPPAGAGREQRAAMMQQMFATRMKMTAHVEQREQTTFALVVARADGRLGPELKPSSLDCSPRPPGSPPPPPPPPLDPTRPPDYSVRCGATFGPGEFSGTMILDSLVLSLSGQAGGLVNNRTNLKGTSPFKLKYALGNGQPSTDPADPPEFATALQEQLGLKLQPEKTMVPVLVVDHIERPTEN
jgi:uncharacterized protein (TIGR03435 family)